MTTVSSFKTGARDAVHRKLDSELAAVDPLGWRWPVDGDELDKAHLGQLVTLLKHASPTAQRTRIDLVRAAPHRQILPGARHRLERRAGLLFVLESPGGGASTSERR